LLGCVMSVSIGIFLCLLPTCLCDLSGVPMLGVLCPAHLPVAGLSSPRVL
jgi:hypothetical protein